MGVSNKKKQTETGFTRPGTVTCSEKAPTMRFTINLVPTPKRSMAKPAIISLYGLPMPHPSV